MSHKMSLCGTGQPYLIVIEEKLIDCNTLGTMDGKMRTVRGGYRASLQKCWTDWPLFLILDLIFGVPK